jgi:hypothetical protein
MSERERPSFYLYAVAGATLVFGAGLGTAVALGYAARGWAPLHGAVNVLGFVGLVVLGAVMDLFAPAVAAGAERRQQHNRFVLGLALAGTMGLMASPLLARAGVRLALGLYLAAVGFHLVGSVSRLRR